jgi:hypothetical protein
VTAKQRLVAAAFTIAATLALGTSSPREASAERPSHAAQEENTNEKPAETEPMSVSELPNADVELDSKWRGFARGCSYLAPKGDIVRADGGVDIVFEFHAGMMAEREMRETGLSAVFVTCGFGVGSGSYADEFQDQARFGRMLYLLVQKLEGQTHREDVHIDRLTVASWSAGFGAVSRILAVDRYYDMIDSVVLLDGLHAKYKEPDSKRHAQGKEHVDLRLIAAFKRFAKDAAAGKKTMVITHSAIQPPDYASVAETTAAMLDSIGVPQTPVEEHTARGMTLSNRADAGGLHVRGFRGAGPRDHFAQLHLFGEVLRSWVVPLYTQRGER